MLIENASGASGLDGFWELKATRNSPSGPDLLPRETLYGKVTFQVHYDGDNVTKYSFDDRGFMFKYKNVLEIDGQRVTELNSEGRVVVTYDILELTDSMLVILEKLRTRKIFVYSRIQRINQISPPNIKQTVDFSFQTQTLEEVISGGWNYQGYFRSSDSPTITCNYFPNQDTLQIAAYEFGSNSGDSVYFDPNFHRSAIVRLKEVDISDLSGTGSFTLSRRYEFLNKRAYFQFAEPIKKLHIERDRTQSVCSGRILRQKTDLSVTLDCKSSDTDFRMQVHCELN